MTAKDRTATVLTLAAVAMAILVGTAQAATTTMIGAAGGDDSWNSAINWDNGVPAGAVDVVISDGLLAQVNNAATPTYSGSLTLNSNSTLRINKVGGSQNAFEGASGITMNAGSKIQMNLNADSSFPPITLAGEASLESVFGASDHQTDSFAAITGSYTLTINGFNNHTYNMNAANTFSALNAICSDRYNIRAGAPGSLGTGDVTITPRTDGRSARLYLDVENTIGDTATLYLNGTAGQGGYAGNGIDWVVVAAGVDEIVAGLYLYGVPLAPGTYKGGDSTTDWIGGSGSVTVVPIIPPNASPQNLATVAAGDVILSWTNLSPNVGSDVWVDVRFGTDLISNFTKVVAAGLNTTTVTVSATVADTYYWQVNSYLDGAPTGDPLEGTVFTFYVSDTDGDGLPDDYELLHTTPPSPTALNPEDDLENGGAGDGLTNFQEYQIGTNPNNPDTDGDTLQDGDEVAGAGLRPPTSPTDADTDRDRLNDGVETNTGAFVSAADTGTDPTVIDSDGDGLGDGAETGTGAFVSAADTGTNPTITDSDGDDVGDWYEVAASFTDPTEPGDKPVIPYPLPDPDSTPPDTTKPVKVYILAGQSNMVGMGEISGGKPGTLQTVARQDNKFSHLVDDAGNWTTRNDVYFYEAELHFNGAWLTVPPLPGKGTIGPELQFGHIMGFTHDELVLVIKTSNGNRSLGWDYRPPSLPYHPEIPGSDEWEGKSYRLMMQGVTSTLDNIATILGDAYHGQGYEIAGFCWFQGHKDQYDATNIAEYETNLTALINDIRSEEHGFNVPDIPAVIATIGFGGWDMSPDGAYGKIHAAQMAVSDPVKHPEFAGNVMTVDTRGYWREVAESPANQGYHYNRNAETYMLVGDAMGRAMIGLDAAYSVDAGDDMITWSGWPVQLDATVQEGVTVESFTWAADPADTVIFDSNTIEDPTVTITKPALTLTEVTIANPGFENPVLADGDWQSPPPAWTSGYYDVANPAVWVAGDSDSGVYNPTAVDGYGGIAPQGDNVMYATAGAGYDKGTSQVLSANLQANTQYNLTVLVGNPFLFNGSTATADYRIELLAGGVILASDAGPSPADDTTWTTAGLTYNSGAEPALLAEALEIRLLAVNFTDGKGVDFDDVKLTAEGPTPDPYTVKLTLTVNDGVNPPVTDALEIDVYDDACEAARIGKHLAADYPGDFDQNCITDFGDLALMAAKWLNDTGLTEPATKP
ncbi:MAG: hypothetical protein JSU94_08375 [Phycisphaerales bacterium]|nr:MAG: hypothetical protein JSU94_08375 [Phycisphaerales bacterium]